MKSSIKLYFAYHSDSDRDLHSICHSFILILCHSEMISDSLILMSVIKNHF